MWRRTLRVNCVEVSTVLGTTSDSPGSSRTSPKVNPSGNERLSRSME
jgi:hypothetical protein